MNKKNIKTKNKFKDKKTKDKIKIQTKHSQMDRYGHC